MVTKYDVNENFPGGKNLSEFLGEGEEGKDAQGRKYSVPKDMRV